MELLTDTTTLGQSGFGSNGSEGVLHSPPELQNRIFTMRCNLMPYPQHPFFCGAGSLTPSQIIRPAYMTDSE